MRYALYIALLVALVATVAPIATIAAQQTVDVRELMNTWLKTFDVSKQKEYVGEMAYIVNRYLPYIPVAEKRLPVYTNWEHVTWAPPDHWIWYNAPGRCPEMLFFQLWYGIAKPKSDTLRLMEMYGKPFTVLNNPYTGDFPGILKRFGIYEALAFFAKGLFIKYGDINKAMIPWLAKSWEWKDEKTFVIHLNKGVTWSDGTPFTCKDVVANYLIGKALGWPIWNYVEDVTCEDDYTVVVHVKERTILTEYDLLYEYGVMFAKYDLYKEIVDLVKAGKTDEAFNKLSNLRLSKDTIIGTGPYVVESLTDNEIVLKKRSDYWNKTALANLPETVRIVRITSNEQAWEYYKKKNVDAGWYVMSPELKAELEKDPNIKVLTPPDFSGFGLLFNYVKNEYFRKYVQLRWAIAFCINREAAAKATGAIFKPVDKPSGVLSDLENWIPKEWWDLLYDYSYSPEKAAKILEALGFKKEGGVWHAPDGKVFKIKLIAPGGWTDWVNAMQYITNMLRDCGFDAEIVTPDASSYWNEWINNPQKYDWDIAIIFWGGFHPHPWRGFYINWLEFFLERWPRHAGDAWKQYMDELLKYKVEKVPVKEVIEKFLGAKTTTTPATTSLSKTTSPVASSTTSTSPAKGGIGTETIVAIAVIIIIIIVVAALLMKKKR